MAIYTAVVDKAIQDPQANVANVVIEFFKDSVSVGQITFRTNDPSTLPRLVADQINLFQTNDTLATYLANPTLGPIQPETSTPPTQDELNIVALEQAVSQLTTLQNYVKLGILAADDPSIAAATTVATAALQTVQNAKQPLPPIPAPIT